MGVEPILCARCGTPRGVVRRLAEAGGVPAYVCAWGTGCADDAEGA